MPQCSTWVTILAALSLSGCAAEDEASGRARETGYRGVLADEQGPLPSFVLDNVRGGRFDFRAEAEGHAVLLFFGYTHCPDICPVHMAGLAEILGDFPWGLRERVKVVFVTVDPERDTPERMDEWLSNFDPSFVGLRGTKEETDRIQIELGLPPSVRMPAPVDTIIAHASSVLGIAMDGTRLQYPFGTRQVDWRHDIPKLANWDPEGS